MQFAEKNFVQKEKVLDLTADVTHRTVKNGRQTTSWMRNYNFLQLQN